MKSASRKLALELCQKEGEESVPQRIIGHLLVLIEHELSQSKAFFRLQHHDARLVMMILQIRPNMLELVQRAIK